MAPKQLARIRERLVLQIISKERRRINSFIRKKLIRPFLSHISRETDLSANQFKVIITSLISQTTLDYSDFIFKRNISLFKKAYLEILDNFQYLKKKNKSVYLTNKDSRGNKKRGLKNLHLYGIYIKDKEVLESFLLKQEKDRLFDLMQSEFYNNKATFDQINQQSLYKLTDRFNKRIDKIFEKYSPSEPHFQKLTLAQQRKKLGRAARVSFVREGVNYSKLVSNQYPRTQVIKASSVGVKRLKTQKKFKTWNSFFDDLVRPWHAQMNLITIKNDELFEVPNGKGGVDLATGPKDPNMSVDNIINCRCSLTFEIYKP